MVYIEQPDGSGHQWLLTDPRQSTDFGTNAIGANQDPAKKARYAGYLQSAYQTANNAVQRIIDTVGVDASGRPNSNIMVTSDHGFAPFHTQVQVQQILTDAGITGIGSTATSRVKIVTSGPAVNIYINLIGREPGTPTVTKQEYIVLQKQIARALRDVRDVNPVYAGATGTTVFDEVYTRPLPADINDPSFGRRTTAEIGQDSGDVYALLEIGYNFDGRQSPVVTRMGDTSNAIFSQPNFYGAHGYHPAKPEMSAVFYAAGPNINHGTLGEMSNIDIAPTIERILGVVPAGTVEGDALILGPAPLTMVNAASRKTHGTNGVFDFRLPLTGARGIEPHPAATGGAHQLVFAFSNPLASGTASVTSGAGVVASATFSGSEMLVNLTGVQNAQQTTVTLGNVKDTAGNTIPSITLTLGFLLGDVNRDGTVTVTDANLARSFSTTRSPLDASSVLADVKLDGKLTLADAAVVKANLGQRIAP